MPSSSTADTILLHSLGPKQKPCDSTSSESFLPASTLSGDHDSRRHDFGYSLLSYRYLAADEHIRKLTLTDTYNDSEGDCALGFVLVVSQPEVNDTSMKELEEY